MPKLRDLLHHSAVEALGANTLDSGPRVFLCEGKEAVEFSDGTTVVNIPDPAGPRGVFLPSNDLLTVDKTPCVGAKLFTLVRRRDVNGVSGTGKVGEGVEFSDGTTLLRWTSQTATTTTYTSIDDLLRIHGHGGATVVQWMKESA